MTLMIRSVERAMAKRSWVPTKKPAPAFKPSALGTPCHRKVYYSYNRVPEDFQATLQLQKYGDMGDAMHERLIGNIRSDGVLIDYYDPDGSTPIRFGKPKKEFPLKDPDLEVSSFIDAVVVYDGKLWLGELKSIGLDKFNALFMPKPEHMPQGVMYLYLFNKALADGKYAHIKELTPFTKVEGIRFLYECRDNGFMKEFEVTEASELFGQTVGKMLDVKAHTAAGTLPDKTPDWCKTCEWRTKCKADVKV